MEKMSCTMGDAASSPEKDLKLVQECTMGDAASTPEKDLKLVQELAMLAWMMKGDGAKNTLEAITAMRVVLESWNKVTKQDQIHALREYTLLSIVDFIKANPHASADTITEEVNRQVQLFASRIDDL